VAPPDPLLVYDGDCAFCTRTARRVERRLHGRADVQAWQFLDLAALDLTVRDVTTAAWWIDGPRRDRGHRAIGRALVAVGGAWGVVGRLLLVPPVSWVARPVYALVARFRHRMPGATDACRLDDQPVSR
jgi:predicted DCC family thiol-disulfide oxidoreductase YuxK